MSEFVIKDSGKREEFDSGMVRDTEDGKIDYTGLVHGPMLERWAAHSTKGRAKYPDPEPGVPNWTLADDTAEYLRFRRSAARHFVQWLAGDTDEDHAAGVMFNINGAEYVRERMDRGDDGGSWPKRNVGLGVNSQLVAIEAAFDAQESPAKRALADAEARRESEGC